MTNNLNITGFCKIRNNNIILDDKLLYSENEVVTSFEFLKKSYKHFNINYPKFFKMDNLSKLGFLTTEILINQYSNIKNISPEKTAIVLSNSSSSLDTDLAYNESIKDDTNFFPSPSVFVYTLPNIMIGEICIRHKFTGENVFFVSDKFDKKLIFNHVNNLFLLSNVEYCITGWVEFLKNSYESFVCIVKKSNENDLKNCIFDEENLLNIYKK